MDKTRQDMMLSGCVFFVRSVHKKTLTTTPVIHFYYKTIQKHYFFYVQRDDIIWLCIKLVRAKSKLMYMEGR